MIFCRTKLDCDNMEQYFKNLGYGSDFATCLHGDRKPAERKANLERFKSGKIKVCMVAELNSNQKSKRSLGFVTVVFHFL